MLNIRIAIRKLAHGLLRSSQVIHHTAFFVSYVVISSVGYLLLGGAAGALLNHNPALAYKFLPADYIAQIVSELICTFNICFLLRLVLL